MSKELIENSILEEIDSEVIEIKNRDMNLNYNNKKMAGFKDYVEFMKTDGMFPIVGIRVSEGVVEEGLIDSIEVFKALSRVRNIQEFTEKEKSIMDALKNWGISINEVTKIKDTKEWKEYENWFRENLPKLGSNQELKVLENNFVESKIIKIRENYEVFKRILKESGYMKN